MAATAVRIRFGTVVFGNMRSALAVYRSRIIRMRRRVARAVSITHKRPELEPVVPRNFTPALAGLMQRDDIVETLAGSVR